MQKNEKMQIEENEKVQTERKCVDEENNKS
jgi:hypothetical protein